MKQYRTMNSITEEYWEGYAESADQVCLKAAWLTGGCFVRQYMAAHWDSSKRHGQRQWVSRRSVWRDVKARSGQFWAVTMAE
jgi:hypothetical protein